MTGRDYRPVTFDQFYTMLNDYVGCPSFHGGGDRESGRRGEELPADVEMVLAAEE